MINVTEVVLDDDFVQPFTVLRSSGQQGPDGWINNETSIAIYGVVSVARFRTLSDLSTGAETGCWHLL